MTDRTQPQMPTEYTIVGPAGTHRGRSGTRHPHTIAADALREITGTPWQRIEYRELERGLRGSVWEVEGFNAGEGSGLYRLTIGELHALPEQQRADLVTARGTLQRAARDPESLDFETAAAMLDRVAAALCPHAPASRHTALDVTNGRPLTTCYACGYTWYDDYPERLRHVTGYTEGQS